MHASTAPGLHRCSTVSRGNCSHLRRVVLTRGRYDVDAKVDETPPDRPGRRQDSTGVGKKRGFEPPRGRRSVFVQPAKLFLAGVALGHDAGEQPQGPETWFHKKICCRQSQHVVVRHLFRHGIADRMPVHGSSSLVGFHVTRPMQRPQARYPGPLLLRSVPYPAMAPIPRPTDNTAGWRQYLWW